MSDDQKLFDDILLDIEMTIRKSNYYHPRRTFFYFDSLFRDHIESSHCFDLIFPYTILRLIEDFLDSYFTFKIRIYAPEEIMKLDLSDEFKEIVSRESQDLSFNKYFDGDYILKIKTIQDNFTVFQEGLNKDDAIQILNAICRASGRIVKELEAMNEEFFINMKTTLTKHNSIDSLESYFREYARNIHSQIKGWP